QMVNINVKWGKEKLSVDVDTAESPLVFKSQLFALTGVAPDRQKVVIKGRTLGDDSWTGITLSEGMMCMMMGSADEIPQAPAYSDSFEAMDTADAKLEKMPPGLKNLGNTCYMNSVLQSFRSLDVIRDAVAKFTPPEGPKGPATKITQAMRNTFNELASPARGNTSEDAVLPISMMTVLHQAFPQFATRSPQGHLQQQDANECFTEVQRHIFDGLKPTETGTKTSDFFRGTYAVTLKNTESAEEPEIKSTEDFFQLSCFLSQEVKYIQTGLKEKMTEEIEKNSPLLGRDCKYSKKALIDRLPAYLSIQMVRFFFKQKDSVNAKILKDVKFPMTLDLFDMCTPGLQEKLRGNRDAFKAMEDAKIEKMRQAKIEGKDVKKAEVEEIEKEENLIPFSFENDPGSNCHGFYDLQAVITHKGRSSDSGHYVAWVRLKGDQWAMCDDDEVHPVNSEQILKLSGGGDWHCAYVLVYGPRKAYKIDVPEETAAVQDENLASSTVAME
ncbi:usp-14, partial [Pristionchus pacificus]